MCQNGSRTEPLLRLLSSKATGWFLFFLYPEKVMVVVMTTAALEGSFRRRGRSPVQWAYQALCASGQALVVLSWAPPTGPGGFGGVAPPCLMWL